MAQVGMNGQVGGEASVFDLPMLKPQFKDEKARVFLPDVNAIFMGYRHTLGGQKNGNVPFGGNWVCEGRPEILAASNPPADPDACPMCKLVADRSPYVSKATAKFVTWVFRYATDPTGQGLIAPFSATLLVWLFNRSEYGAIKSLHEAWDVTKYDLLLNGKSKDFQTWDVSILPVAMWQTDPAYTQYVQSSYAANAVGDIERIIARKSDNDAEIMAKLVEITTPQAAQYQQMPGYPVQPGQAAPGFLPQPGFAPQPQVIQPGFPAPQPVLTAPAAQFLPPQIPTAPVAPEAVLGAPGTLPAPPPISVTVPPAPAAPLTVPTAPVMPTQPVAPLAAVPAAPPVPPVAPPAAPAPEAAAPTTAPAVDFTSLLQVPPAPAAPAA